ncbi:hypothetical protein Vafri_12773 [Volvox africanus]|uniref:Uncharacterized protein n=1 Tax=Volvox africanus TaxID=51714 RepID=A0A8J4BAW3_9CHLO|nr:hypothetical protein Vafri_12773 [Volvox africanus]
MGRRTSRAWSWSGLDVTQGWQGRQPAKGLFTSSAICIIHLVELLSPVHPQANLYFRPIRRLAVLPMMVPLGVEHVEGGQEAEAAVIKHLMSEMEHLSTECIQPVFMLRPLQIPDLSYAAARAIHSTLWCRLSVHTSQHRRRCSAAPDNSAASGTLGNGIPYFDELSGVLTAVAMAMGNRL